MSFHAATIGQLLIVEAFVFFIWIRVFIWTLKDEPPNPQHAKLLATSSGLVITSFAVTALMLIRAVELYKEVDNDIAVIATYCLLAFGNFLFIVSASINNNWKQAKLFAIVTLIWTGIYIVSCFV